MKAKCGVLGIHPLFGPLAPSVKNQLIIFARAAGITGLITLKMFSRKTAPKLFLPPLKNDREMAIIQALTHFINIVLARTLQKQNLSVLDAYTTPVFRLQSILMGRILGEQSRTLRRAGDRESLFPENLKEFFSKAGVSVRRSKAGITGHSSNYSEKQPASWIISFR